MSILEKLEHFIEDLEREAYETGAGLKEEANFSAIFEKAGELISQETVNELKTVVADDSERSEYLSFLLCMIIDRELKEVTDQVLTMELEAVEEVEGKEIPYRRLQVDISNESSHERRAVLDAARANAQEKLNGLSLEIMSKTHELAAGFGYSNYREFFEKIEGVSLDALRTETEKLLAKTEKAYLKELSHYSESFLKMKPGDLEQYDLMYMRRGGMFDAKFPADALLGAVWTTMDAMGIQAREHPHVRLDIEERPAKSPRAFCCPVRVPEEVYLVIMPHGGVDDYSSFLHELGHTLHYAHANASLPLAARHLGDNSVTEAHAGTLEHLIFNPEWLKRRLGFDDTAEYFRFMKFFELYMLRRYCAKLHYEMELHGGAKIEDCGALYAKTLTGATKVKYNPVYYLQDVDSHFYCARYLRAWMLERQIRTKLETSFGIDWFDRPEAGKLLLQMWSTGQRYKAETVSAALGFDSLNFDDIISDYAE